MKQQTIIAINTLIQAIHVGQTAGAYSLEDSTNLYSAIKYLEKEINTKEYERNETKTTEEKDFDLKKSIEGIEDFIKEYGKKGNNAQGEETE